MDHHSVNQREIWMIRKNAILTYANGLRTNHQYLQHEATGGYLNSNEFSKMQSCIEIYAFSKHIDMQNIFNDGLLHKAFGKPTSIKIEKEQKVIIVPKNFHRVSSNIR